MTADEKKAWLRSAYRIDEEIRSHVEELRVLRLTLSSVVGGASGPHAPRYDGSNAQINGLVRMIALEEKIKEEVAALEQRWTDIHDAIEAVESPTERLVLRYRYIERMTLDEVAAKLKYSTIRVRQIIANAIDNLQIPGQEDGAGE